MARTIKLLAGNRSVEDDVSVIGLDSFFAEMAPGEVDVLKIECKRWLNGATLASVITAETWLSISFAGTLITATLNAEGATQTATIEIAASDTRVRVVTLFVGQNASTVSFTGGGGSGGGSSGAPVPTPSDADTSKPLRAVAGRTYRWADPTIIHFEDFNPAGNGSTDDYPKFLQFRAALVREASLGGSSRIVEGAFGAKPYLFSQGLDLRLLPTTNNKVRIVGSGERDTTLLFDFTGGGAAVSLPGIYGSVAHLTIAGSAARKAGAAGTGLLLDGSVIGATTTQLGNRIERVRVIDQPGDAFSIWRQEQLTMVDCQAENNIGRGFALDAPASVNTSLKAIGCRAENNGLNGWRIANAIASSFINCFSLYNMTAAGSLTGLDRCEVRVLGTTRTGAHFNWDIESEFDLPYGMVLSGSGHALTAGYFRVGWTGGASSSEVLYLAACTNSTIWHPDIRGRSAGNNASSGITTDVASTGNTLHYSPTFPDVTTAIVQATRRNVLLTNGEVSGSLRRQTSSYTVPTSHTPNTAESEQVITLTGNATINAPTGPTSAGTTLVIWLVQDATGGRTVTWNATYQFGATAWSNTGNTANRVARVEFAQQNSQWRIVSYRAWET